MKRALVIVDIDKQWARARIAELEKAIQDLGPEFYDVFNQSSETWHDNAPFDALRDRQSVLDAELQQLRSVLRESLPTVPKPKRNTVSVGSIVTVDDKKGKSRIYEIAGDWTYRAGQAFDGRIVVSTGAPIAKEMIGKKVGDEINFGTISNLTQP